MFPSKNIDTLIEDFSYDKAMVLFLGAGCDLTFCYPEYSRYDHLRDVDKHRLNWDNLLKELTENACVSNDEYESIISLSSNTLKAAILKHRLGDSYIPIIQNWLYSHCNRSVLLDSYPLYKDYQATPTEENLKKVPFGTLFVLAELILRQHSIKAVITQNYNNFLSEAIKILLEKDENESYGVRQKCKSIDVYDGWKDAPFGNDTFLIYHVHGYILSPSEKMPKKESNHIVLSDEEFYQMSKDVFSWQNVIQINYLTHYCCIMLGLSLDDLTTLRLLRHANIEAEEFVSIVKEYIQRWKKNAERKNLHIVIDDFANINLFPLMEQERLLIPALVNICRNAITNKGLDVNNDDISIQLSFVCTAENEAYKVIEQFVRNQ